MGTYGHLTLQTASGRGVIGSWSDRQLERQAFEAMKVIGKWSDMQRVQKEAGAIDSGSNMQQEQQAAGVGSIYLLESKKNGHIPSIGKLIMLTYFLIGSATRVFAFILFFTPSLGIFNTFISL